MDTRTKAQQQSEKISDIIINCPAANDSLFGGELSVVLYCYYLYEATGIEAYGEAAIARLEKVLLDFSDGKARLQGPYYCNGVGGLFYLLVLFASKGLLGTGIKKILKKQAGQLFKYAALGIEHDCNDFVHGSFGLLHCFNLYAVSLKDDSFLQSFLRLVEEKYLRKNDSWIISAIGHPDEKKTVNLSLAHGQAGLLILLMQAYNIGGITPQVKSLLQRNAAYLLACKREVLPPGHYNFFPAAIDLQTKAITANERLAWCYGDLGQALFLYKAAAFFNSDHFRIEADSICIKTTERVTYNTTLLQGAQVCHGMGGVAHFYQLLGELSGLECCKKSSAFWMEQAIGAADDDIAKVYSPGRQLDVIEGLPGIGLVLMSYLSAKRLDWGKMILLD
jgi:lantibiotic biosynthesis protein